MYYLRTERRIFSGWFANFIGKTMNKFNLLLSTVITIIVTVASSNVLVGVGTGLIIAAFIWAISTLLPDNEVPVSMEEQLDAQNAAVHDEPEDNSEFELTPPEGQVSQEGEEDMPNLPGQKGSYDTSDFTAAQIQRIIVANEERERNNKGLRRNDPDYMSQEELAAELNYEFNKHKSRFSYARIWNQQTK